MTEKAVVIMLDTDIQSTRRLHDMVKSGLNHVNLKGDIRVLQADKVRPLLKFKAKKAHRQESLPAWAGRTRPPANNT